MWALMGIAGKLEAHFASARGDLQLDATVTRMLDAGRAGDRCLTAGRGALIASAMTAQVALVVQPRGTTTIGEARLGVGVIGGWEQ